MLNTYRRWRRPRRARSRFSGHAGGFPNQVFFGRERHANVRAGNVGYPIRAIRTAEFLYLRNFEPDRRAAGDPPLYGDVDEHLSIDGSPSKQAVVYFIASVTSPLMTRSRWPW